MPRRVRRPREFRSLMKQLVSDEEGVFDTYADLLIFCGLLGFSREKRFSFEGTDEQIAFDVFENRGIFPTIIRAIALSEESDLSILKEVNSDSLLTIFEEYSYGGLRVLSEKIQAGFVPRDAVIDLCHDQSDDGRSEVNSRIFDEYELDL